MKDKLVDTDRDAESLIKQAKENGFGYLTKEQLDGHKLNWAAREKILNYGLMIVSSEKPFLYHLTERGWNFTSFKEEDELELIRRKKIKTDYRNSERLAKSYPFTQFIAWASFIVALILGFLKLAEVLKLWPYHK